MVRISYVYKAFPFTIIICYYMLYETKKKKWQDKVCISINRGNKDVENKRGILYNDTVDQLKGCGAAW